MTGGAGKFHIAEGEAIAAGERTLLSFGARRMHPAITPMVERSAWLGGCDGVSAIAAAELLGMAPTGTLPHALVLCLGDTLRAARAFDEAFGDEVSTIVLIDTFQDEKFETLRIAEALGARLYGVRFIVSGGIDPDAIRRLNPLFDGYGVGTHISAARTVDFSLDIVEIDGRPIAKRGQESGRKALVVCGSCEGRTVVPAMRAPGGLACPRCGAPAVDALQPPLA